ncbi:hypothetical protein PROFUN_12102 [Planoprotostelium fungivorum]|uniref:Histone-lysine N-methyltransferase, H3 lysine-79 specific n=1 Tax=Planoprotostelium fungivorum TaxID=1890364 RepID=A0A2P6N8C3_9EUKA|nr:hypothetical protein PROFUN_12102 [Planoprotostelium fungivorum]
MTGRVYVTSYSPIVVTGTSRSKCNIFKNEGGVTIQTGPKSKRTSTLIDLTDSPDVSPVQPLQIPDTADIEEVKHETEEPKEDQSPHSVPVFPPESPPTNIIRGATGGLSPAQIINLEESSIPTSPAASNDSSPKRLREHSESEEGEEQEEDDEKDIKGEQKVEQKVSSAPVSAPRKRNRSDRTLVYEVEDLLLKDVAESEGNRRTTRHSRQTESLQRALAARGEVKSTKPAPSKKASPPQKISPPNKTKEKEEKISPPKSVRQKRETMNPRHSYPPELNLRHTPLIVDRSLFGVKAKLTKEELMNTRIVSLIECIYEEMPDGHRITKKEESTTNRSGGNLDGFGSATYGEIVPAAVMHLIKLLEITERDVFYDLGSGIGKAVIQIALQTNVKRSVGVELSETRYNLSLVAAKDTWEAVRDFSPEERKLVTVREDIDELQKTICFLNSDILDIDISDATCIYWNNICFNAQASHKILLMFKELPEGTRVLCSRKLCRRHSALCITKNEPCCYMSLARQDKIECTWAESCTVFIYTVTKRALPNWWDQ